MFIAPATSVQFSNTRTFKVVKVVDHGLLWGGRKRSQQQDIWCFSATKLLKIAFLAHQMKQHFKCTLCNKKASNVGGLSNHMMQVHKSVLGKVPNSIAGRDNPKTGSAVNGMSYIPQEALRERVIVGKDYESNNVKRPSMIHSNQYPVDTCSTI